MFLKFKMKDDLLPSGMKLNFFLKEKDGLL